MKKIFLLIIVCVCSIFLLSGGNVFGQASDLSGVIVYPNPFIPDKGHTLITFEHITEDAVIKIYKINGELVRKIEVDNSNGITTWNVTNDAQKHLGSGGYIYLITNSAGEKVIGKIAIVK